MARYEYADLYLMFTVEQANDLIALIMGIKSATDDHNKALMLDIINDAKIEIKPR